MTQWKTKKLLAALAATAVILPAAQNAHSALERMGPINNSPSVGGFPAWFQDKTGLALEFCDLTNPAELTGGWCTLIPPGPVFPETFPNNFFIEHFYSDAVALASDATTKARLIAAVEASFANGATIVPGQQMTFGRIRVFITHVPSAGTYTVYHPYGKWTFANVVAGDRIFFTEDVGLACVATFECTLGTSIGPFLLPSPTPGGVEVPAIPDILPGQDPFYDIIVNTGGNTAYPGTGKKYIADPKRIGPVTGSPLPPFVGNDGVTYDHNVFRVEGPNGWSLTTTDFTVTGRILNGALPGNVTPQRASYAQNVVGSPTGKKLDVFATGQPTVQGRLPTQPLAPAQAPIISFYDQPCGGTVDPVSGATLPPFTQPIGATQYTMVSADVNFWAQAQPVAIPTSVCVEDNTSRNAAGQVVPTFYMVPVTDEVAIATTTSPGAIYNPLNGGSLTVKANSSDTLVPPALTLAGYGPLVAGTITVAPLAAPPAKVTVLSSEAGSASIIVTTGVGIAGGGAPPVANNDAYTMFEDCSALPATACATPLVINPLANDTVNGAPLPAGAVITITQPPRLGTVVVNPDNTMTYTPNANANGIEGIAYIVTSLGATSNQANIAITISPVNDLPVAVDDAPGAVVGKLNSFNVLANDTDPDGVADLSKAQIVTWPAQLGVKPTPTTGAVNFTPATSGTFTFTYRAVDFTGAVSANTANAVVVVSVGEAITVAKAIYTVAQNKWVVQGADSVKQGQTLTIAYANGTFTAAAGGGTCNGTATIANCVLGTVVVDSLGNYLLQSLGPIGGPSDPTDVATWASKPSVVNVFSSSPVLGGSKTNTISVK